jgi:hypothetical protein
MYRIAVHRSDQFEVVEKQDDQWTPLEELESKILAHVAKDQRPQYRVTRPHYGGVLWEGNDPESREEVLEELIAGGEILDSLEPVIEVLKSDRASEDFANEWSWVKEDFERSFFHKRLKVKVRLIQTLDDRPVWDSQESCAVEDLVFRHTLRFFDPKDQKLVIALRHGRTIAEMARSWATVDTPLCRAG